MDSVDSARFNNIRDALINSSVDKLLTVCPSMSESEAYDYIAKWEKLYLTTMEKIRASMDTSNEVEEQYRMLHEICDNYPYSRDTIHRF